MNALPDIHRNGTVYRLPLLADTSACLIAALAEDSVARRTPWLSAALGADSAFALWSILRFAAQAQQFVQPLETAQRLSTTLAREFARPRHSHAIEPGASESADLQSLDNALWADLIARSRAVSSGALVLASQAGGDASCAEAARVFGLLHLAADWLMAVGQPHADRRTAIAALPPFLAVFLERLAQGDISPMSTEFFVQQAIRACAGGELPPPAHAGDLLPAIPLDRLAARMERLEQLETDFQRAVEEAKLEALKEFAYGAGHEINNPLANISARAQTLLKDERDPERRQKLAAINTQAFRAHEMIADLMLFARPPEIKPERLEVAPFLIELARNWQAQAAQQQTEFELRLPAEPLAAWADRSALAVALRALVSNALEALSRGGKIQLVARPIRPVETGDGTGQGSAGTVEILVWDNGPGIGPEIRPRLFDPYFSGREAGRGLGFGLSKCWRIVTAHGGRIEVASDVGAGAAFSVTLPAASG